MNHQTQLWVSDPTTLEQTYIQFVQQKICPQQGCNTCSICHQIAQFEHPATSWHTPEKGNYSNQEIDAIIHTMQFQLEADEQRFIVLSHAEKIPESGSNKLLKPIEEPYPGYTIIFCTNQPHALLSTITSRCVIQNFMRTTSIHPKHDTIAPFLTLTFDKPIQIIKKFDTEQIKEYETKELLDYLIEQWSQQLTQAHHQQNKQKYKQAFNVVTLLQQQYNHLPMPGSTKLFWKNIMLALHALCT